MAPLPARRKPPLSGRPRTKRLLFGILPVSFRAFILVVVVITAGVPLFVVPWMLRSLSQSTATREATQVASSSLATTIKGSRQRASAASASASAADAFCTRVEDPLVCAHGGVNGLETLPNTVSSLVAALEAGYPCIEVDVSRTQDGQLVAMHSRELRTLTDGVFSDVGVFTLGTIQSFDAGRGASMPTLEVALRALVGKGLRQITIDMKDNTPHGWHGLAHAVLNVTSVFPNGCPECVFWGKEDAMLREVRSLSPTSKVGFSVANFSKALRDAGADVVRRASCSSSRTRTVSMSTYMFKIHISIILQSPSPL